MMYEKILTYVQEKQFFKEHKKVLIAISGGVDSMNLLHFLHSYQEELGIELGLAHINHNQRAESIEEENYLKQWAKEHHFPIYTQIFQGVFSETNARDYRYRFFEKIMIEEGYTALVTAHHADDQAETIFMRLIRGSRLRHLVGIKEVQDFANGQLIRPFLSFSKSDLPNPFHFDDASNDSPLYFRNRVRHQYLPLLSQENSKFCQQLLNVSHETNRLLEALRELTSDLEITDCAVFQDQTEPVQYFLLQEYLSQFPDLELSKSQFNQLLYHLSNSKNYAYDLKADYQLIKDQKTFQIVKKESVSFDESKILIEGNQVHFSRRCFTWLSPIRQSGIPLISKSPITLRYRQAGDQLDFGHYHKKLRRWFIDEKIPSMERQQAIIGEQEGQIIFVLTKNKTYLRKLTKHDIIEGIILIGNEDDSD
ncbi:tRNA lysidine(34) synthetase TilS [Streptococcus sp. sy010]|uniref:tRNA lysidine(34) synthetase TilS n=1 Tax=Streptococcus sp. sy010 TaxID=2600148 RepID=UPI0011B66564|nr:tRNA lysidine(34) synthetase TilS [Streptococcus sp. sy010]TWT14367.1 tRNA lysidine(34) synthetase TilS [Streptococcus sp. sy010]